MPKRVTILQYKERLRCISNAWPCSTYILRMNGSDRMWCKVLMFQPIYHVSVSPTNGNGPTQGQRKTLTRLGFEPTTFEFDHRCSTDWATRSDGSGSWETKMLMARQWICWYKERLRCISNAWTCSTYILRMNGSDRMWCKVLMFQLHFPRPAPVWPCSSVGGAAVIKLEGRGFKSHPGQRFPLSLCGPISICRANAHMVYGLKHQHFRLQSITTIHNSPIGHFRVHFSIYSYFKASLRAKSLSWH